MLVAFVPVLHKGYLQFFKKYPGQTLGILGADVIADFTALTRDLRIVDPQEMQKAIEALGLFDKVIILSKNEIAELARSQDMIIMPNEDVSTALHQQYLSACPVTFSSVFLRWDMPSALSQHAPSPDRKISQNERDQALISLAQEEAEKSADFWRQIGAVITKDGAIVSQSHNRHLPTNYHLFQNGDPRSNVDAGTNPDVYTSIHAETNAIADCAKRGIALEGASLYVTTFPCSNCARLIAQAGIKKVYYEKGYSRLDAEEVLKAFNVELFLVQ